MNGYGIRCCWRFSARAFCEYFILQTTSCCDDVTFFAFSAKVTPLLYFAQRCLLVRMKLSVCRRRMILKIHYVFHGLSFIR
jgi:hypothetical protein